MRILALDAGGVKCLSSLILLGELMKGLSPLGTADKPYKYFDLICGAEWGGVLAIMLGRLQMSIDDCIIEFSKITWDGSNSFKRLLPFQRGLNNAYLEKFFQDLVKDKCRKQDTLFYTTEDDFAYNCKTAVLAFNIRGESMPTIFRSYFTSKEKHRCEIPIWKIAMAVISNPMALVPAQLQYPKSTSPRDFIDASIVGYSNPSREALIEGKGIFSGTVIKALINIGTGDRAQTKDPDELGSWFPTNSQLALIRLLTNVSNDPRRVAYELERDGLEGRSYCRYSVESGLHGVHNLDFSSSARQIIEERTDGYLSPEVVAQIRGWSAELKGYSDPIDMGVGQSQMALMSTGSVQMGHERTGNVEFATRKWFQSFKSHVCPLFWETCEDEDVRKIKVAVLDTGIDANHPFMPFVSDGQEKLKTPIDTCGHGTHIAGIILNMAPHVELYVARVFESRLLGEKDALSVAKAINHATENWKVDIISMSFGFVTEYQSVVEAIEAAYDKDIVMLAAVSNDGNRPFDPIAFPARHPCVICINSADGDGNKSSFNPQASNRKGKTHREDNFSILGQSIKSCWPETVMADDVDNSDKQHGSFKISSGSSFATAIAASVAALIMELGERKRGLISKHKKLKTYRGIQQVFTRMAGEDEYSGFKNIRPWLVLQGSEQAAAHLIDKEVKNP